MKTLPEEKNVPLLIWITAICGLTIVNTILGIAAHNSQANLIDALKNRCMLLETRVSNSEEQMTEMIKLAGIHGEQIRGLMKSRAEHQTVLEKQGELNTTILKITGALAKDR